MDRLKTKLISSLLKIKGKSPLNMARYAASHTKFYNNFYKNSSLDNFEKLPVVTKYDLIGISPYDLLSDEFKNKVILYGETSGSSGSPTSAFFTKSDFEGLISLSLLSPFASEVKNTAKLNRTAVNGLTFGFTIAGFSFGSILQKAGFLVAQLGARSTIATPERMAKTIVKLKPSVISATPLDFISWLKIIKLDYPDDYPTVVDSIKLLLSTAEPCARSRQHQIEKFFNITHINTYASVDGLVSLQCPCGEMHLIDNLLEVELLNSKLESIGPYGTGRLCFTNLVRKSTPMVRFLLDDLVTVKRSNCRYGYSKSIYPHGRYELSLDINGRTLGNLDFEEIIYRHGLFMNYKVDVYQDKINIILEDYDNNSANSFNISELQNEISSITGTSCIASLVPLGDLTEYRKVRGAKSIIKVSDKRKESRQEMPCTL